MSWQIALTVWIIVQTVLGTCSMPRLMRMTGKTDAHLAGAIAGSIAKGAGMIACLYFGGYYA